MFCRWCGEKRRDGDDHRECDPALARMMARRARRAEALVIMAAQERAAVYETALPGYYADSA